MSNNRKGLLGIPGLLEISPLAVGVFGIAIPVAMLATAAATESVVVLVLALLTILPVGAATLLFILRLASDPEAEARHGE